MSIHDDFLKPLRFIWNHSQLLAPARQIAEDAEDWTDRACAVGYLVLLGCLLYGMAIAFSWTAILSLGALAIVVILVRIAIQRLS